MKALDKRGVMNQLQPLITALVGVGIVLVIGFLIMAEVGQQAAVTAGATNFTSCDSAACNGTKATQSAIDDIPDWLPIIVITVIGVLLLGLVRFFSKNT